MTQHPTSPSNFGNPLVQGIVEIPLPAPVPWMPTAPGWTMIWGVLALTAIVLCYRFLIKWKQNGYRRQALGMVKRLQETDYMAQKSSLCALPRILKFTALAAFRRTAVASLSGESWIAFLESRLPDSGFSGKLGKYLLAISYQHPDQWDFGKPQIEAVFSLVKKWILDHRREPL